MKLNKKELLQVNGGARAASYSSFINAISRGMSSIMDVGRSLGTAIRRIQSRSVCGLR